MTSEHEVANMKTEFISHAAHELRTPMTSIFGYIELLLAKRYDEKTVHEMLQAMQRQSTYIINMINELLDLAKIDAKGEQDFNFERLDIHALLEQIVTDIKLQKPTHPIKLKAARNSVWVHGDGLKISQAIMNVLTNAEKYSPDGAAIHVQLVRQQHQVGISIKDQGIGMSEAQIQHVGERFWRADHSGNRPGTGLGMSIVKEIMHMHRGYVEISSTPAHGTQVTLWFPLA